MLKLLRESQVASEFIERRKSSTDTVIAVPFWGNGAIKALGLDNGLPARIICNLSSGACNPYVIEKLKELRGVEVHTNPKLHAKIYATKNFCIVGSSNASTNGLTVEGSDLEGWIEANVLSDDPDLLSATLALFNQIWSSDTTKVISDAALRKAKIDWDNRPKSNGRPTAKTLLAACRQNHEFFSSVYFVYAVEPLSDKGEAAADKEEKAIGKDILSYEFEKPVELQPGNWLVAFDHLDKNKPEVMCGLIYKIDTNLKMVFAIPQSVFLHGTKYSLPKVEKNEIIGSAENLHAQACAQNHLLCFGDAVRIIDNKD